MRISKSIELTSDVNSGESVIMTFTLNYEDVVEEGYTFTEIKLNSYSSQAIIRFSNLTPEVLREAADKLEQLVRGK